MRHGLQPSLEVDLRRVPDAPLPHGPERHVLHLGKHPLLDRFVLEVLAGGVDADVEQAEGDEQHQGNNQRWVPDVVGFDEVQRDADARSRDELLDIVVREVQRVREHLVANARQKCLHDASGHVTRVPRKVEPPGQKEEQAKNRRRGRDRKNRGGAQLLVVVQTLGQVRLLVGADAPLDRRTGGGRRSQSPGRRVLQLQL
mmetsp:Transcript_13590/g.39162  ORF Transcript_13590/g.39162 Transcript_13590/m.39162 type:complete len:200 (-) Transcript_13590:506-1105(-)